METIDESDWLTHSMKKAIRPALIYLIISAIWILGTNILLADQFGEKKYYEIALIINWCLFIILSSILIYFLIRRIINSILFNRKETILAETRLKYLFDWASDAIYISDNTEKFVDVNQMGCQISGYSREELLTKHIYDLLITESGSNPFQLNKLSSGKTVISEQKLKKKNGSFIIVEISSKMLPNKYFQAIVRDITERKLIEEELRKKTEEINLYFNRSMDLLSIFDTEGYFHRLNPAWETTLGYSLSELEEKRFLDFVHPDDIDSTLSAVNKLNEDERVLNFTNRYRGKDGTYRWLEWNSSPFGELIYSIARDITDQKLSEEKLKEQEQLLVETGRIAKVGGWEFDTETLKGTWTPEVAKIHDLDPEKETNAEIGMSFYHGENRIKIEQAVREAIELGKSYDLELELTSAAGKHKWVRTIGRPVKKDNKIIKLRGSFQDITKQKLTEIALRESESNLAAAQARANIGSWELNLATLTGTWSAEMFRLFYRNPDSGTPPIDAFMKMVHPEDRQLVADKHQHSVSTAKQISFEFRSNPELGPIKIFLAHVEPIKDTKGNITSLAGTTQDITERKQIENSLRESEERYRKLVDITPDAIAIHSEGKVVFVNDSAVKLMKAENENDLIGKPITEIIHPDNWQTSKDRIVRMLNGETGLYPVEDKYIRLDGIEVAVEVNAIPLIYKNKHAALLTARDITERKIVETELLKSREKYRSLSLHLQTVREEERSSIAREMHDELGQILTSLKMNLSLLRRQVEDKTKNIQPYQIVEEINSTNRMIDKAVKRVRKLITQLRPELLDKLGLLAALEWYVQEFSKTTKIECEFSCSTDELILGPEAELAVFRIIQETLTNTAKHSGADKVVISILKTDHEFIFKIKDNGKGISEEELKGEKSFGLLGMRERAELIGASLEISGELTKGTVTKLLLRS